MSIYGDDGLISQTYHVNLGRQTLRNPLIRPSIINSSISRVGKIAIKADQILSWEIPADRVIKGIRNVPLGLKTLADNNLIRLSELRRVIARSNEVLASAKTVWPFTLFRDDIIVDRTKITITKRSFFFVSEVMSIRIEDVLNVKVSLGPFLGSLTLAVRVLSSEDHHTINFFWRDDAVHLKHIIQGYIIAHHNKIDVRDQDKEQLVTMLTELGHDRNK